MINFQILGKDEVSEAFLKLGVNDFQSASYYIAHLPYRRNKDKTDLLCVFKDQGGTCSTKHAVLRKLALENRCEAVQLILGIFRMDAAYAPKIANTLQAYGLDYIPEAHNYLK